MEINIFKMIAKMKQNKNQERIHLQVKIWRLKIKNLNKRIVDAKICHKL